MHNAHVIAALAQKVLIFMLQIRYSKTLVMFKSYELLSKATFMTCDLQKVQNGYFTETAQAM